MAINIKNERTVEAVKRLAAHYGVSYTTAIETAAQVVLQQPNPSADQQALQEVRRIVSEYRAHLPQPNPLTTDQLYDEDGLYR